MRIRGQNGPFELGYVDCQISGRNPQFNMPLTLAVDTGCTRTTIMDKDAAVLNLNYRKLDKVDKGILGIGGKSRGWFLGEITINFPTSEPPNHAEHLPSILISKHIARTEKRRNEINAVPSVLGLDLLRKSRIAFDSQGVILEFPPF